MLQNQKMRKAFAEKVFSLLEKSAKKNIDKPCRGILYEPRIPKKLKK